MMVSPDLLPLVSNFSIDTDATHSDHAWITLEITQAKSFVRKNKRRRIKLDGICGKALKSVVQGELIVRSPELIWLQNRRMKLTRKWQ